MKPIDNRRHDVSSEPAWFDKRSRGMEIGYKAPDHVRAVIESLGRTEDVRFSPNNRRLAVAAFNRSVIAVFDVKMAASAAAMEVLLTGVVEISSPHLNYPHGLDFIDDETLAIANREGDVLIFSLPPEGSAGRVCVLSPIQVLRAGGASLLSSPGSVAAARKDGGLCELLICNNSGHSVTRHVVDRSAGCSVGSSQILLRKGLNIPDGVCVSNDGRWIAVSNHHTHNILLYENSPSLSECADPDGVLRSVYYPHGLRFSADGRHIFAADAGAPYIHVYANGGEGWRGARTPVGSFRVMDDAVYLRGRNDVQEGGPKGIDIDRGMNLLVVTSEHQPLAFFDLPAILRNTRPGSQVLDVRYELGILEQAARLQAKLIAAEARAAKAEAKAAKAKAKARAGLVINGKPWRIAGPLRRIYSALRRRN